MERRDLIQKSLEKIWFEPEMSDNDYYTVIKRIEYQNNVQAAKKPVFDVYLLDEDTLLLLARIDV